MDPSNLRLSSVFAIGTGTIVTGFLAYAIYFDHQRRNNPDFRKALKRESKLAAKAEQQKKDAEVKEQRQAIKEAVERANAEPIPADDQERETYFMENIQAGEDLTKKGDSIEAATAFFKCLKVYPRKGDLISMFDKTVPKEILEILATMISIGDPAGGLDDA